MAVSHWLRLPLALAIGLGLTAPAHAQLWKPTKKKPAATVKAKSAPTARKASPPSKRKPKARATPARKRVDDSPRVTGASTPEYDDAPVISIIDVD